MIRAEKSRKKQKISIQRDKDLLEMANKNSLKNCYVTTWVMHMARKIFGPCAKVLQEKCVLKKKLVVKTDITPVPQHILQFYKSVMLKIKFMHVNSILFLVTLSRNIHYGTTTDLTISMFLLFSNLPFNCKFK